MDVRLRACEPLQVGTVHQHMLAHENVRKLWGLGADCTPSCYFKVMPIGVLHLSLVHQLA